MKNIELTKSVIGLLSCYNYLDPLNDLAISKHRVLLEILT